MAYHQLIRLLKRLQPYNVVKGLRYLKHFGWKEFMIRLSERMEPEEVPYGPWYASYAPTARELEYQRERSARRFRGGGPVFSLVVPVYRPRPRHLKAMLDSVLAQTYPGWELCLVNADPSQRECADLLAEYQRKDERVRVKDLGENRGISGNTNEAIAMARGEWIAFLDHDDLLSPAALFQIACYLERFPQMQMVYTDEDKVREEAGELAHLQPNLKPDFNPSLLLANNYICHLLCIKRELLPPELVRGGFDGAQDYDLILRCAERAEGRIGHVPEILYHWRIHGSSTADNPTSKLYAYQAGQRAIREHLERTGQKGRVERKKDFGFYRVIYPVEGRPLVSIIIPNKDQAQLLDQCLTSIRQKSTYDRYEIIIVENNSCQEKTFAYYHKIADGDRIRVVTWEGKFNYAAINNFGARYARGDYLLLLNNDIRVITPDWMEELLGHCQRPRAGAVGARLYYPDDTYQHAGIVIGIGGVAGSLFVGMKRGRTGYLHKAELTQDLSAVTAACMMLPRRIFEEAGGFEEKLAVAFNDVDLCLRLREKGYRVIYDPYVEMVHYESKSRGKEDTKEKVRRFQTEIEYMRTRWENLLREGDPMYNKNLSLSKWNYSLNPHPRRDWQGKGGRKEEGRR